MNSDILTELFLASPQQESDVISMNLQQIIGAIRSHFGMDIAFISDFVEGRRVIKYVDSIGDRYATMLMEDSLPLEESFCQHVADGRLPQIIPDVSDHVLAKQLPLTKALSIGSYLGVPLKRLDGEVYGMFCCIGHQVDESLGVRDIALMKIFADLAGEQIAHQLEARQAQVEMLSRIRSVMVPDKLSIVYQPIYTLKGNTVAGYESLSRFVTKPYRTPDVWFDEAAKVGLGEALEILAIEQAITGLQDFDSNVYISLNVSPESILSGAVNQVLSEEVAARIVLEITEHSQITNYAAFRSALEPLKQKGVRLAVDDAGAGYASFQHILELGVDIIKLDISLIKGIDMDQARSALAAALIAFAKATNTEVVAEGVETREEFKELLRLGVDKVQGYYIGHPMPVEQALHYLPSMN